MVFKDIENISKAFGHVGCFKSFEEIKAGHINCTYKLTFELDDKSEMKYILQKINSVAFKDPEGLMNNIGLVTEHIASKLDKENPDYNRRFLHFLKTDTGSYLYTDGDGSQWRSYVYVGGATAHNYISDPSLFYESGKGFGTFQNQLSDFPAEKLIETIPNFHNTPSRYEDFLSAVRNDRAGRAESVKEEIAFLVGRSEMMSAIVKKLRDGTIPVRVTHNDTKLNNVLIDNKTHKAICVIDLDTVMPGSALYDYGDAIRYGACTAREDEKDLSAVDFDMELFKLYTKGFLEEAGDSLTEEEIKCFPLGVKMMSCELALRFLTDYLEGDVYFKTNYPEHNLARTRVQIQLLRVIDEKYDKLMNEYISSII